MNNDKKMTWAEAKEVYTLKIPYWATIMLIVAAFRYPGNMNAFLLTFLLMVLCYQEKLMNSMPKSLLRALQGMYVILTVFFLLAPPTEEVIEFLNKF